MYLNSGDILFYHIAQGYRISAGEDAIASCGEGRYTLLRKNIAHQLQWYILVPVALVQTVTDSRYCLLSM